MAIHLQERDIILLKHLADDFLLLTRDQIQQLIGRQVRRTNQRLSILIKAGYISRREAENIWDPRVVFYYLGEKAGDVLHRERTEIMERRTKAENYKIAFLKHLYEISTIHIRFLTYKDEGYAYQAWIGSDPAFWDRLSLSLRPDSYVRFSKNEKDYCCFIEMDRGTERGEYIQSKIDSYHRYDRSGAFRRESRMDWFRVLFVTEKASHAKTLSKLFPTDTFLVATIDQVRTQPLFAPYWLAKPKIQQSLLDIAEVELRAEEQKQREQEDEIEDLEEPLSEDEEPPLPDAANPGSDREEDEQPKAQAWYWRWVIGIGVFWIMVLGCIQVYFFVLNILSKIQDWQNGYVR